VDDVVDDATDSGVAATKLAWWRGEVARAYAGTPSHPVMQALMPLAADYGIGQRHLLDVVDGCQMDLEQTRYLDFAGLQRYCHLVAGIVGEVAANIFGQTSPQTTAYAHRLGLALQLTNIIRDVGEDALRGSDLPAGGGTAALRRQGARDPEAPGVAGFPAALPGPDALPGRAGPPLLRRGAGAAACRGPPGPEAGADDGQHLPRLLREIERDNFQVLRQRVSLTPLRKFWLAWRVQALGRL
jgi:phytoene synthase